MQCKVDGCDREARYKAAELCQKHYFRQWRYGTTDTTKAGKAKPRFEDDRGYQFIYAPTHPLVSKGQSYVAEHRMVLYAAIGPGPMKCELCRCEMTWKTCQTDHIDENPRNNARENLRPLCRRCNTWRSMPPAHVRMPKANVLTWNGETKTAAEWARDPRVNICGRQIALRLRSGMTAEQALFAPKVTHNGSPPKPAPRKTQFKHERKNAIRIEVDGVVMTAAEWARHPDCRVTVEGLIWRIKAGWDHKRAVFTGRKELRKETA